MSSLSYSISILFIEDEKAIRDNYVSYLKKYCVNVYEADDGETALKIYKEKRPELLIIDINIPKLNGLDLLKKIRETDYTTRAIMLTAQSDVNSLLQATELNLTKYLIKPVTRLQLKEALESAFTELEHFTITSNNMLSLKEGYIWNFDTNEMCLNSVPINFTKRESKFMSYMMHNYKHVCTFDEIMYEVWGCIDEKKRDALKSLVRKIRQKIPKDFIENVFGVGYKIKL